MRAQIRLALLASCLSAGCVTEATVRDQTALYARDNKQRLEAATKDYLAKHHLTEAAPQPIGPVHGLLENGYRGGGESPKIEALAKAPAQGLRGEEWLVRAPEDGRHLQGIVFASSVCLSGSSCGCDLSPTYTFATAPDGHAVVLRLSPQIHEHRVKMSGSCTTGCGVPPEPREPNGYMLPPTDPAKVEIADVPYDMDKLIVSCANEVPAP